jgi:hypothetical protein
MSVIAKGGEIISDRTITVTLPDTLYERVRQTAMAASLSFDEVLAQSIALSLPALERELSAEVRSELAALALLSDTELRGIADSVLDEAAQFRLEDLAALQKQRPLSALEQSELAQLMEDAQHLMLRKAEAYRLLARRGHAIFDLPDTSSD